MGSHILKTAAVVFIFFLSFSLYGHGTQYEVISDNVLAVRAAFEGGAPMQNATVLIFAPGQSKSDLETATDARGVFYFVPTREGMWSFQVRAAGGHGMRINLMIDEHLKLAQPGQSNALSLIQKLIMAFCVVFGLAGFGMFFYRKGK